MPCALTQGYTLDCKESIGGVKAVWFIPFADVTATVEASGVVTTITKSAGKVFYKYQLVKQTSSFTENITASVENGTVFYASELSIILNKLQANTRNEILLLAKNNLLAVVQDGNDKYWFMGKINGADLTGGNGATGTAFGDRSGYTLTFTANEPAMCPEVVSSIIAGLTV